MSPSSSDHNEIAELRKTVMELQTEIVELKGSVTELRQEVGLQSVRQEEAANRTSARVSRIYGAMFEGNGDSLLTRVKLTESTIKSNKARIGAIESNTRKLIFMAVGAIIAAIGGLIFKNPLN